MIRRAHFDPQRVREEIAIAAARMIAEDGLDYASAKRKAARQVVGDARIDGAWLPDNDLIEEEIREYQALFQGESQPVVLRRLREIALDWMRRLDAFNPFVTGAVLNGTAGQHSDIHLQIFCDNPKDVAIWLLNANVQYDVSETPHFAARTYVETLSFMYRPSRNEEPVGIHVALYDTDDLRGAVRADARGRLPRANAEALKALIDESDATSSRVLTSTSLNQHDQTD
ncbi:UDP-N-acetylmuramate--alanine ligase [Paraburkholderia dinghuensis]|uniref:UDP-N-acetylmuramate--alanine ligase n=1 Tax=Paraburkholderia dinghuensis TaxID=2305225 RepID=A0A3N6PJ83_9BURK|nr:UDP-N-acetylmuramate--alanine ligase [Paraburkholderia dinghuensis]RQH01090.1 UDP-N-acetylmuramate--alanine ligase [Paraburkholderia dinghuensis]